MNNATCPEVADQFLPRCNKCLFESADKLNLP